MIILSTVTHETIWGGEKLVPYSDGSSNQIGHLYSLCCEAGLENRILNGAYKGKVFQDYFVDNKDKFGLGQYKEFPLIIALVEANDNLSIQVHPDDKIAMREEHADYGKNESWYFMESPKSGAIYDGCLAEDIIQVKEKMEENNLMSIVDTLPVQAGDYVYVEAGTLHALSKGSLLYEIEENSPWTYRMYDYDRTDAKGNKRELHIDKALEALKPELKSKAFALGNESVKERRYTIQKLEQINRYKNESKTLECITLLDGSCTVDGIEIKTGMTVVLEPQEQICGKIKQAMMARPH